MIYRFSDFSLDPEAFELAQGGDKIAVEPQAFGLLHCLIENRDRVVSKDELIDKVWDGRIVSDAALTSCVNAARRAVGDDGKSQAVIKAFPRRGFRFVAALKSASTRVRPRRCEVGETTASTRCTSPETSRTSPTFTDCRSRSPSSRRMRTMDSGSPCIIRMSSPRMRL